MKSTMNMIGIVMAATVLCTCTGSGQPAFPQTETPPAGSKLTIPSGQKMVLSLETSLHTRTTHKGDPVEFVTAADVNVDNQVVIPNGSQVRATVTKAKRAGRLAGRAEIQLRFDEVRLAGGTVLPIRATVVRAGFNPVNQTKEGEPQLKGEAGGGGSVREVAQGGGQGAILGAITRGGKGALYGGAVGAGVGLAGLILRRGPDLDLPRTTMFEARFDRSLDIPAAVAPRTEQVAEVSPVQDRSSETAPDVRKNDRVEQAPAETATIPDPGEVRPPVAPKRQPALVSEEARPADPSAFKLSVKVQMVVVDAVVKDRAGRPLDGLKQDDFRVFEDSVEQPIRSFSRDEFPLAVALIIDRSGSVAPFMNELRQAAYRALQQLKPGDQVALFSFAGSVERLEDLTTDRQRIADRIAGIRAGGGTDIMDALFDATNYLALVAPERRRAIILVSDNQGTTRPRVSEDQTIRAAMETETVVYSIKTAGEATPLTLRAPTWLMGSGSVSKVAHETGGEIIDVKSVGSLDAALGAAVTRLRLRYSLGYYPPNPARDGAFHGIEVRLAERLGRPGSDYSVHARRGYYATADRVTSGSKP